MPFTTIAWKLFPWKQYFSSLALKLIFTFTFIKLILTLDSVAYGRIGIWVVPFPLEQSVNILLWMNSKILLDISLLFSNDKFAKHCSQNKRFLKFLLYVIASISHQQDLPRRAVWVLQCCWSFFSTRYCNIHLPSTNIQHLSIQ